MCSSVTITPAWVKPSPRTRSPLRRIARNGQGAATARVDATVRFAKDVARFLGALGGCDASGGPAPGAHNWFRGGPLAYYEAEALRAVEELDGEIDRIAVLAAWEDAMRSTFD